MASKELKRHDQQRELALTRRADPNTVPLEMIRRQKTANAAFCLALQSSGLEDNEVASCLDIDPGYFSRIKGGTASLQTDLIEPFCFLVNNRIYPEWIAYRVGCTLMLIQSEAERQLEAERELRKQAETKVRVLMEAISGKVPA